MRRKSLRKSAKNEVENASFLTADKAEGVKIGAQTLPGGHPGNVRPAARGACGPSGGSRHGLCSTPSGEPSPDREAVSSGEKSGGNHEGGNQNAGPFLQRGQ